MRRLLGASEGGREACGQRRVTGVEILPTGKRSLKGSTDIHRGI